MPLIEIFRLAYESILANKLRAGLTMLGMIIGVGAVVLLVSIGNGAKNYISSEFESLGSNYIVVQPGKSDGPRGFGPPIGTSKRKLTSADVVALQRLGMNLDAVTGIMFGTAKVKRVDASFNVTLIGVNDQFIKIFKLPINRGTFISQDEEDTGRRVVVIGHRVANDLFPNENPVGQFIKVNESAHRVIGTMPLTGQKLGLNIDELAIIPTRSAMRIFNDTNLFGIRASARSKTSVDDAVTEITEILKERRDGEEDFTVLTQASIVGSLTTIMNMLTYVLLGIAMISMLVGGIGIMNIMLVSVTERTREIGIRRAVGGRKKDVLMQFMVEAIMLSTVGGLIGMLGSLLITLIVYFAVPTFDMRAPIWILIPSFLMSLFVGVVFGILPARKAANIETIEALRFE